MLFCYYLFSSVLIRDFAEKVTVMAQTVIQQYYLTKKQGTVFTAGYWGT